jgi:hypothetical protein
MLHAHWASCNLLRQWKQYSGLRILYETHCIAIFRIHNCPPRVPLVSQINPVHAFTSYFLNIHLNIIRLNMGPIGCTETSVWKCHSRLNVLYIYIYIYIYIIIWLWAETATSPSQLPLVTCRAVFRMQCDALLCLLLYWNSVGNNPHR